MANSIGNYVWLDTNGNGIQDATETGVKDVVIRLLDTAGEPILTTNSNRSPRQLTPMAHTNLKTSLMTNTRLLSNCRMVMRSPHRMLVPIVPLTPVLMSGLASRGDHTFRG